MDINKVNDVKVSIVREQFHAIPNPDGEDGETNEEFDRTDPEQVFDWFALKSDQSCSCPKHLGIEIICATCATILHDFLENRGLEWSDAQKGEISSFMYDLGNVTCAIITMIDEKSQEKAKRLMLLSALIGTEDSGVSIATLEDLKGLVKGIVNETSDSPADEE